MAIQPQSGLDVVAIVDGAPGWRPVRDAGWLRAARRARWLACASLAWMTVEGVVGLVAGLTAGSIALVGWALGSAVEGLASVIVIWRFSGSRIGSDSAERRAQRAVAVSFWVLAPYVAAEAVRDLIAHHHPDTTWLGIVLTAVALLEMPLLARTKHKLGAQLDSAATTGEGTQNYMCAVQAAAVLVGLVVNAAWSGGWWADPLIALSIAGWAVIEGRQSWAGQACGCGVTSCESQFVLTRASLGRSRQERRTSPNMRLKRPPKTRHQTRPDRREWARAERTVEVQRLVVSGERRQP